MSSAPRITVVALLKRLDNDAADNPTIDGRPLDDRDLALVRSATEAERKLADPTWAPPVLAVRRRTNAEAIEDCARLGYLRQDWLTLDPTFGRGTWWQRFRPDRLITHDLYTLDCVSFRALPEPDCSVDAVAFDPPYKLNGTPALGEFDDRYGVGGSYTRWQDRHALICAGITECYRVLRPGGTLLVKCEDQVCSGAVRWQTREFTAHAESLGAEHVDELQNLGGARPQPMNGRTQRHAHGRPSTLLVLRKR